MNIAVGLAQSRDVILIQLRGDYKDAAGKQYGPGSYRFGEPVVLEPLDRSRASFVVEDVKIGIGFHWERNRRQGFRGGLRIVDDGGLTLINDVDLESYVESVIASEMNADSPVELLKAHAVISRSWLIAQMRQTIGSGGSYSRQQQPGPDEWEIQRWYGTDVHTRFDVCGDDHCQRYQGIGACPDSVRSAVQATRGQFLVFGTDVCDARFSKCCGGVTEDYSAVWDESEVPYLRSVPDGPERPGDIDFWIRSDPRAHCNAKDEELLRRILPDFDFETHDFFRWSVRYNRDEISEVVGTKSGIDLGTVTALEPLERGSSGRITRLRIVGNRAKLTVGKELEIRRVLSATHLFSSAFVVDENHDGFTLVGAGWGHGVGLCQIGAAVMASGGIGYEKILSHYYSGASVEVRS